MSEQLEKANKIRVGDEFHVLGQALMLKVSREYNGTRFFEPGATLVVTDEMMAVAAEDPKGSWVEIIPDRALQVERWGRVRLGLGKAEGNFWRYGDPVWESQRRAALEVAWAETNPAARARVVAEVQARFARGQGQEAQADD